MMENKNFCQPQEKLSEDAWKILAARTKKKEQVKTHNSGRIAKGIGGGDSTPIESSNLLFKIKRYIRRIIHG
jgi:hypothetical protein